MTQLKSINGLPVFDAKRPIKLHVLASDIAKANTKEPAFCAAANACRRDLKGVKEARVHLSRVYLRTNDGNWTRYITPKSMRQEIVAFDRGGSFEPGEFTLSAPQPTKVLGKKTGGPDKRNRNRKNEKPRKPPTVTKNVRMGPA